MNYFLIFIFTFLSANELNFNIPQNYTLPEYDIEKYTTSPYSPYMKKMTIDNPYIHQKFENKFNELKIVKNNTRQIFPAVINKSLKEVPYIYNIFSESSGAGIFISNNEILTNAHVVLGADSILFVQYSDDYTTIEQMSERSEANFEEIFTFGEVYAIDKKRDLALIKFSKDKNITKANFGKAREIKRGEEVFAIGHPLGNIWSLSTGTVSAFRTPAKWSYSKDWHLKANVIQTIAPVNGGNSGGPLYNSFGNVIGVIAMGYSDSQGLNYAIRVDEVQDFIKNARNGKYEKGVRQIPPEWKEIELAENSPFEKLMAIDLNGDGFYDQWLAIYDIDKKDIVVWHDYYLLDGIPDMIENPYTCDWLIYTGKEGMLEPPAYTAKTFQNSKGYCVYPDVSDYRIYVPKD